MITILDGNAFYLRITGKTKVGEYEATLDLAAIDSLIVNFVRRVRESQTVTHDQGKVLAYNDGKLAKGVYGVEMVGYYNGQPWRFYAPEVFEIADDGETEASNVIRSVNVYDVTFYMKLGGDGVTPGYVDAAVTMHNTSEDAHTDIREAVTGIRTQVERRLVGAKVTFSDGHTEDVELGFNDQGEVILLLPKETFGKIDGVKVNGDELPVDNNGKVDIPIPTTVHDLDPDDAYATKEDAQAMVDEAKVTGASVDYQEDGGAPSATVDFSEGSLDFKLKNMKMRFSELLPEEIAAITGPQGIPGDNCIPLEGESPLAQVISQATDKAITPKAVQDAIGEYMELPITVIPNITSINGVIEASNTQNCWCAPVKIGDVIKISATSSASAYFRVGFITSKPELGMSVSNNQNVANGSAVDAIVVSPIDGYVVINHSRDYYNDQVVKILKKAKAGDVEGKANANTLKDLVQAMRPVLAENAIENEVVSNKALMGTGYIYTSQTADYKIYKFNVQAGKMYRIKGMVPANTYYVGYIYYDANEVMIGSGIPGQVGATTPFDVLSICPDGAAMIYVQGVKEGTIEAKGELYEIVEPTTSEQMESIADSLGLNEKIMRGQDAVEVKVSGDLLNLLIKRGEDKIGPAAENTYQRLYYIPVKAGDHLHITATSEEQERIHLGFTESIPASGVSVLDVIRYGSATSVEEYVTTPVNGYFVVNNARGKFSDLKITVNKSASANELSERAAKSTLLDLVDLNDVEWESVEPTGSYFKSVNKWGRMQNSMNGSTYNTYEYVVTGEKIYMITCRLLGGTAFPGYVFLDENDMVLSYGDMTVGDESQTFNVRVISPRGAAKLYVNGVEAVHGLSEMTKRQQILQKTIYPKMSYDYLSVGSSTLGHFSFDMQYNNYVSTIRFIKVNGGFSVLLPEDRIVRCFEFGSDFNGIRYTDYSATANEELNISVGEGCTYVKIVLFTSPVASISIVRMRLRGNFPDNWDTFNISQKGCDLDDYITGRQVTMVRVRVTDPTCCDDDSSILQDNGQYLWDYGKIFLPATYDNLGEPTRLIIYCHGAAVNYTGDGNVTDVEKNDLDPTYWLAEGYAVLDTEGNPFDNQNEHICMPQAMDCYVAAYKWAIEHYNLKRDGVFLGGRSMGGYNTFNLMRRECPIPVIAACPNVPSSESFGYSDKNRKAFCALHMGFDMTNAPDGFEWSSGGLTDDEWQILYDNWDKWVKCVPFYNMCTDLPDKDIMMSFWKIEQGVDKVAERYNVLSGLHMIAKCPVKLFGCHEDQSCPPMKTSALYYRMLINAGQIAELRLYHDSRCVENPTAANLQRAHHYDMEDPAQRIDGVVTRYGASVNNVPIVYVEMLKFWRRYEQE